MSLYDILDDPLHFPRCEDVRTLHINNETNLPENLREYLLHEPTKQRKVGRWLWNAPDDIRRGIDEPGYAMAIKPQGMGHKDVLYWNHEADEWLALPMGGSSPYESAESHKRFMSQKVSGYSSSIEEQMELCKKDLLFSKRK